MSSLFAAVWSKDHHCRRNSSLRQSPELSREAEALEDAHVLLACVRRPLGRQAIAPPRVCELAQLRDRNRGTGAPPCEPACDVLLRPEEVHPASGEDDVLPPPLGGDEAMEEQGRIVWPFAAHGHRQSAAAVG